MDINIYNFIKLFPKISDIIYFEKFHIKYNSTDDFCNNSKNLNNEINRINKYKKFKKINSPIYLFLSLSNTCIFEIYKNNLNKFKWKYKNKKIWNGKKNLNICDGNLVLTNQKNDSNKWDIINNKIKNIKYELYISCDVNYNIILTKYEKYALKFNFENNGIHYIKSDFRLNFDKNIINLNINTSSFFSFNTNKKNICILLAAGNGKRFGKTIPKQLLKHNKKYLIEYSIDAFVQSVDYIIIVTNSICINKIKKIIKKFNNIFVIENNDNCRLKSIEIGLKYTSDNFVDIGNVLLHDSARPFITSKYITDILLESKNFVYSQYYLPMVNGLSDINDNVYDNSKYYELCTPICIKFNLLSLIFEIFIKDINRISHEIIPILNILQINYKLIQGDLNKLKKITYSNDMRI
jgi:2-C-methyl-D-erythritol 4-phosphate cytidylyltransferase